ncbi:MAG: WbqC family protein [Desulfobacterales bacterium]|nr:MAG: WbqC family protein [Desulfobacterales bacterium]
MILSTYQPYFAPYPGFFYKAHLSDIFVVLDNVQFPRGTTWITRNRFKNDQGILWMTVPVWKKGRGLQIINEVRICREGRWARKHLASLQQAYDKAPYFRDHLGFMAQLFSSPFEKLIDLNMTVIKYLMQQLGIQIEIRLLSELPIQAKGEQLLIQICQSLGAACYLAQSPARKFLDAERFRAAGLQIQFFHPPSCVYPQLWGNFLPDLSALDLLFNCGPRAREILWAAGSPPQTC